MPVVGVYVNSEEASLARARLESSGIAAALQNENTASVNWLLTNAIGGIQLVVSDEDYESARELLSEPPPHEGILSCPYCGSWDVQQVSMGLVNAVSILAFSFPVQSEEQKVICLDCEKKFSMQEAMRSGEAAEDDVS